MMFDIKKGLSKMSKLAKFKKKVHFKIKPVIHCVGLSWQDKKKQKN